MSDPAADTIELLSSEDVSRTIARIAHQIIEKTAVDSTNAQPLLLLGIPSGGVPLARRLAEKIHQFTGVTVPVGSLDITLYRDDLRNKPHRALQKTNIPIDKIDGTNIITTSGIDHHCPPSLGVFTSVQITMLYLQENLRQQTLAGIFGTSQPTISRAINTVLNILDVVLPPPPQPVDLNP
ncbi:MAG: transposase family protein, partial [Corynebacterium matruchotii]